MNSPPRNVTRRAILRATGGIAVGLPFLESFPKRAHAQAALPRFVVAFTPNGSNSLEKFHPQGAGANFTLGYESEPVLPFKSKLLAITGVNMASADAGDVGDQHAVGMGHMLTARTYSVDPTLVQADGNTEYPVGFANGISVDQAIANAIGAGSRYKSLEFGVQTSVRYGNHPFSRMIYAGPVQPVSPEDSPMAAYTRLFGGGVPQGGGDPAVVAENLLRRRSVIDFVMSEYQALNAAVPAADRERLEQHLTFLRQLEQGLESSASGPVACDQANRFSPIANHNLHENFPTVGRQQADLLVFALACGLTRVASLQYSYARSAERLEWIDTSGCSACGALTRTHHGISHEAGNERSDAQMSIINRWYSQETAYLLSRMDTVDEGGSTLLDNSLVFWCSEIAFSSDHTYDNIRAFLFGSAGGKIRTGQHLAVNNQSHTKLHVAMMNAVGVNTNTFGDPQFGTGALAGVLA
jgi:hypothetical protein